MSCGGFCRWFPRCWAADIILGRLGAVRALDLYSRLAYRVNRLSLFGAAVHGRTAVRGPVPACRPAVSTVCLSPAIQTRSAAPTGHSALGSCCRCR